MRSPQHSLRDNGYTKLFKTIVYITFFFVKGTTYAGENISFIMSHPPISRVITPLPNVILAYILNQSF